jgi:O-antigen ligase
MPPTPKPRNFARPAPAKRRWTAPDLLPKEVMVKFVDVPRDEGLPNVGNYILCVLIFVIYSRVLDLNPTISALRLPLMMSMAVCAIAFMSGSVLDRIGPGGRYLLGFTIWVIAGAPFGHYRTQSMLTIIEMLKSILIFIACAALITTPRQSRRALWAVALSSLASSLIGSFSGETEAGRLKLDSGSLKDPNTFAMFLLMGLPIWWYFASRASKYAVKVIYWACTIPILLAFGKTGSRGGMVAFGVVLLASFLRLSAMKKVLFTFGSVILLAGLYATLPPYLKVRYFTIFAAKEAARTLGDEAQKLEGDTSSSEERYKLLIESLLMTAKNPIFGVGAGNFANYLEMEANKRGGRTFGQPTHNSYTEISSEAGLPALIFFIAALAYTLRRLHVIVKARPPSPSKTWTDLMLAARYLRLSLLSVMVCCFFLNYAYKGIFQPLLGIITGVTTVALGELIRLKAAADKAAQEAKAPAGTAPAAAPSGPKRPWNPRNTGFRPAPFRP